MKTIQKQIKIRKFDDPILETWQRIQDLKNSRDKVLKTSDLDAWEKSSLPKEVARSTGLKNKNPSKIRKGDVWSSIQTAISLTIDQKPILQFLAAEEQDQKKSVVLQNCLDYIWDKGKGDIELYYLVLSAARYGTGIAKVYYRSDPRKIKDIEFYNPETGELKTKEKLVSEYNDIYWETIDIRNFFPDDRAYSMDDMVDCFERKIISWSQFKSIYDNKKYKNISEVIENNGYLDSVEDEYRKESPFGDYSNDKVEIIVYVNKLEDQIITFANGVVIQDIPIPYKHKQIPYARCVFFPRGKEYFWGVGIPELLSHNSAALDTILNISIDKLKRSLQKPTYLGGGEEINQNIEMETGIYIPVQDVNNVKESETQPPDRTVIQMMDYLSMDAKDKTGIDNPLSGVKTGGTATENAIAKESGLRRMKTFLRLLEGEFMYRLGRLIIGNIQQFYGEPLRIEKINGEDVEIYRKLPINIKKVKTELNDYKYEEAKDNYFEVRPDDIMGNFDVRVVANSSLPVSRELEFQKVKDMIAVASGSPLQNIANWTIIGKKAFGLTFNDDGTKYLVEQIRIEEEMKELAKLENDKMIQGQEIPATEGAPIFHTARHLALATSPDYKNLSEKAQEIINNHIQGEKLMQSQKELQAKGSPNQNMAASGQTPLRGISNQQVGLPSQQTTNQPTQQIGAMR